jgi:hypothetical protein
LDAEQVTDFGVLGGVPRLYCAVEVASVVEAVPVVALPCPAESVGTIEGAAAGSMMTVLVLVDVRPVWSVARKWEGLLQFHQERGYGAKLAP